MIKNQFDLLVIGAGVGGYPAAVKAAKGGLKTAIIHNNDFGGTCLNRGCIPVKTLLYAAHSIAQLKKLARHGIKANYTLDFAKLISSKNRISQRLSLGVKNLLAENKVALFEGTAAFINEHTVKTSAGQEISAKNIILAAGAVSNNIGINKTENILMPEDILQTQKLPQTLAVIGGGAIGIEIADMLSCLGTKVYVIEIADHILPNLDEDIALILYKELLARGIKFYLKTSAEKIDDQKTKVVISLSSGEKLEVEKVLICVGNKFDNNNLGLKFALGNKGEVEINKHFQTNFSNIYAIGDINGKAMYAHAATAQGLDAVDHILGKKTYSVKNIPFAVYTSPEIGIAGIQKKDMQSSDEVITFNLNKLGRLHTFFETTGLTQIIIDKKSKKIKGAAVIGPNASEIIGEAALAIDQGLTLNDLKNTVHIHPTMNEVWGELAHA